MREIRLGLKIIKTLVKDRVYYPGRLFSDIMSLLVRCGLLLCIYSYVFKLNAGQIKGYHFSVAAWSMFLYFIFLTLRLRDIPSAIMEDVKSGNIEVLLNKPISYLYYRAIWQVGTGLFPFLVLCFAGTLCMAGLVGVPNDWNSFTYVCLLISILLCSLLCIVIYSLIGLCAFWIEDILPLNWLVDKFIMMFAGAYVPIAFLPEMLQNIAIYSPFGAAISISNVAYPNWNNNFLFYFLIQIFWISLLGGILFLLFNRAQKQLSVNGG